MGFDVLFLIFCGIGFISGYKRGIIYMAFFVAALFLGVFATLKFSYLTSEFLFNNFGFDGALMPLISLILTFVVVFGLVLMIAGLITKALKVVYLNSINRVLGGLLGAIAAAALVSVATWYIHGLNLIPENFVANSSTYQHSLDFAPALIEQAGKILPSMGNLFEQLENMFDVVQDKEIPEA